jgi:DNA primase
VLDGDAAGRKRANEVLEIFLSNQLDLRVVTLPEGLDPCDFLLQRGREALEELITQAPDALDHKISVQTEGLDLIDDTQQAHKALESLLSTMASAPAPRMGVTSSERLIWEQQILNRLSRMFHVPEETIRTRLRDLRHAKRTVDGARGEPQASRPESATLQPFERELFELLLQVPDAAPQVLEEIAESQLGSPSACVLYRAFRHLVQLGVQPGFHELMQVCDDPAIRHLLVDLDMAGREKPCLDSELVLKDLLRFWAKQRIDAELHRCLMELNAGVADQQRQMELLQRTVDLRRQREQ